MCVISDKKTCPVYLPKQARLTSFYEISQLVAWLHKVPQPIARERMKKLLWPTLLALLLCTSCTDAERHAFESKCDAPLRTRVESVLQPAQQLLR